MIGEFEAEPTCWRHFDGRTLKPDAYAELGGKDKLLRPYFIEVDRANQYGSTISNKLPQYLAYYQHQRSKPNLTGGLSGCCS